MMKADLPVNEDARLKALYRLSILDSEKEQSYDDIAQLAASLCMVPIAVVSLIDKDRQWFKSCVGLNATETHRDVAFCAHAILNPCEILEVEDATRDPRFSDNPLVLQDPNIRFYAGAPLITQSGYALGTLCVIDSKPRTLSSEQKKTLMMLANQIVKLLELRELHREVSEQAKKYSSFYQMAPVAISLSRFSDGVYLEANPEFYRLIGYSPEEFVGSSFWNITPEQYHPEEELQLKLLREFGRYGPYEKHFLSKQGSLVPVLLNGILIEDAEGRPCIWSVVQDITEIKRVEQLKNEFVSTVSHELRTPLTSISGALKMVLSETLSPIPDKIKDLLSIAARNSERLVLLINDLLDMEKLLAGKMTYDMQNFSVSMLVEQALFENKTYAEKYSVSYRLALDDDCLICVDRLRFQQVLSNFLSNAAKFSPKNSTVEIKIEQIDSRVKISVRDFGKGIPAEFHDNLFKKFSQIKSTSYRRAEGTGLGLAISKELVEAMHGSIGFTSVVNQGSCFFISFPIVV